jgi:acyl-CoA thioesterase-2
MPEVPGPETLEDDIVRITAMFDQAPPPVVQRALGRRSIEQRSVHPLRPGEKAPPINYVWMRARAPIGPDPRLHQALLAYASDMGLLSVAARPHGLSWQDGGLQVASLDHAIWFHRPLNFNEWHLYAQDSPSASGARGFTRGELFSASGVLVASMAQEGLVRLHDPD